MQIINKYANSEEATLTYPKSRVWYNGSKDNNKK